MILDGEFLVKTSGNHDHNSVWLTTPRGFIEFSVEACAEAHIALAETPGVLGAGAYEVVLGADGNTKSRILKDMSSNETVAETDTPGLLDCNKYQVKKYLHVIITDLFSIFWNVSAFLDPLGSHTRH